MELRPLIRVCEDCDEDGKYHIQSTEYDFWLCKTHMIKQTEINAKISKLRLKRQFDKSSVSLFEEI